MNSTAQPQLNPKTDSLFGFIPTLWVCVLFICLYAITTTLHFFQSFWYRPRLWWWLPTVCTCGVAEIIGWSGRLWGHYNPYSLNPYLMQICTTIFAPSFMTAAMFIIFVRIIIRIGPEYSRLQPKIYSYALVSVDTIALVVQAIGGAKAASSNTPEQAQQGARVMVGGIIVQMAAITVYALLSVDYFWHVYTERPLHPAYKSTQDSSTDAVGEKSAAYTGRAPMTSQVKQMMLGLAIATVLVFIRSIYRTIELLDGWGGPIITNQTLFDCLDGIPIVLAMLALNVFHPGRLTPTLKPVDQTTVP